MNDELTKFRRQIDEIDEVIIEQLIKRTQIVKQVGEFKQKTASELCPIRSGREAEMVRRIVEKFRHSDFPATAAAAIWRIIIGASTSIESKLILSVFSDSKENNLYWLAREYFGSDIPVIKQPHTKRVIGDLVDGKAAVGIVPFPRSADNNEWWIALIQQEEKNLKVFAQIPFVCSEAGGKDFPSALAIAKLAPEPSGDDISLFVIEAEHNVSQNRLQTAFVNAGLEATWLNIENLNPASRHHLVEIKGFITPENEILNAAISSLGRSIFCCHFLGAYATPITVNNNRNN